MKRAFGYRSEQRKRSENQDSFGVFPFEGYTLAIVCDGMGGHVGGAQASTLAVRTVHEHMQSVRSDYGGALRTALERANQAIYEAARKNHRLMGMGTTAVAAVVTDDGSVYIAHVGDSRAYLINEGQAVQVTRDHTMVNLFVDAELLSPEDAATHPEAHVLSRSLGVERQVEVELSEPIELADNDVVFLCSDGVHGVVTDWELGSVDWAAPEPGIAHVLQIVEAREGDDNATAVAVLIGEGDSMPASPLPEEKALEDSLAHAILGDTQPLLPDEEADYEPLSDPTTYGTEPSAPGRQAAPTPAPAPAPTQKSAPRPGTPTPAPIQRSRASQSREEPSRLPLLLGLGVGVLALAAGALVVGYLALRPVDGPPPPDELTPLAMDAPKPAVPQPEQVEPVASPEPAVPEPETVLALQIDVPKAPRRLPHRPKRYTQKPPTGSHMFAAVQSARDGKCAESLVGVQEAMDVSPDHAKLYSQAWYCFGNGHAKPLSTAELTSWEDLGELEAHFRGWPPPGEDELTWEKDEERLPVWFRAPKGGIEYRLDAWATSDDEDMMRAVMIDLMGEPSVTDDLARDVFIEAQTAVALAGIDEPDEGQVEAWARRVFVARTAMEGRVGRLLKKHRPELVPRLEQMLTDATTVPEGEELPEMVAEALAVATGQAEPPTTKPKPRANPVNALPKEPDLGEGSSNVPGVIHR